MDFPLLVSVTSLALMALSTWVGDTLRKGAGVPKEDGRPDANLLAGAILTLLFFISGFSFSTAINPYDLRKNFEQAEAIAIGTAYSDSARPKAVPKEQCWYQPPAETVGKAPSASG
jgi:hypothetical protein